MRMSRKLWKIENSTDSLVSTPLSDHDFVDGLLELSLQQVSFTRNSLNRQLDLVIPVTRRVKGYTRLFYINNVRFGATGAKSCKEGHKLEVGHFLKKNSVIFIF